MTGIEKYDKDLERQINDFVEKHSNMVPYLSSYANYLMSTLGLGTAITRLRNGYRFLRYNYYPEPHQITFDDYTAFYKLAKDKSPGYANGIYYALRSLSEYFYVSGKVPTDLMKNIKKPKLYDTPEAIEKRNKNFLNEEEMTKLLQNAYRDAYCVPWEPLIYEKVRDYVILYLMLTTGIRCAAIVKSDVDNVDIKEQKLIIREKGEKVITYTLSDNLANIFDTYLSLREERLEEINKEDNALFFSDGCDHRIKPSEISHMVKRRTSEVTDKNITPHKLRASYCTNLYNQTKDLYFVQKCMHHNNPRTTERYIRTTEDEGLKSANIMDDILGNHQRKD